MIKNLRNKKNKKGFTLIELIVVIAILAILALVLVPSISNYVGKANAAKNISNVRSVHSQLAYDVAMDVKDGVTRWGYKLGTDGVVENTGEKAITLVGNGNVNGVPEGMSITYHVEDGQVKSFTAKIGDKDYKANEAGQIVEVEKTTTNP